MKMGVVLILWRNKRFILYTRILYFTFLYDNILKIHKNSCEQNFKNLKTLF